MSGRYTTSNYLEGREDMRPRELVWGGVREAPAPKFGHQSVVTRTTVILDDHVRRHALGVVCVSPVDVVLDEAKALVVQPDVIYVSNDRRSIVRDQVWGAPDMVVEVASRSTAARDRTTKLRWYRRYGVAECWLLDPHRYTVTVVNLGAHGSRVSRHRYSGRQPVRSTVLPLFEIRAEAFFD